MRLMTNLRPVQSHAVPQEALLQVARELRLSAGTADQLSLLACVRLGVRWCKAKEPER